MDVEYPGLYTYVFLPLLIFAARFLDVTLMTLRIIFISRGKKTIAPLLGFVEVFIWIAVVTQIVRGANNLAAYLAYAAGFALGNYVGIYIEDKLAIGTLVVRVIVQNQAEALMVALHEAGFGVTGVDAQGSTGPVKLIYSVVKRRDLPRALEIIHAVAPNAFSTVEEVRSVEQGIFPQESSRRRFRLWRKAK
jgi:uncharacterized protein YebE (UPF0316 family)